MRCMDTASILDELEDVARRLGIEVRSAAGNFRGGRCTVEDEDIIMLNDNHLPETRLRVLATALHDAPLDTMYLKPAVRRVLEEAWADTAEVPHDSD